MTSLTFVTQNKNKIADAKKLLPEFTIEHVQFDVPEIQSLDLKEITDFKLQYAYKQVQKPCFVMDASLFLQCLNGFPGPFIKWYYKYTVGAEKTCQIAKLFDQYGVTWTTVLGYFDGEKTHFFEETVQGTVANEPRGTNGFDWDKIFIPKGDVRTFAQMNFDEKQNYAVTKKLFERFKALIQ